MQKPPEERRCLLYQGFFNVYSLLRSAQITTQRSMTMKKMIVAVLAVAAFAGSALAADVIEMKKGVSFKHKAHVEAVKDCKKCHENGPGKIAGFGKDFAHKKCKECHNDLKKGPTNCKGCHTK
jgi:hypothetical protein